MGARPLNGAEIRRLVAEVAAALAPEGGQHVLIVVGGSLLAWHGLRDATEDVDSLRHLDAELRTAAAEVAAGHDLAPAWLNSDAAGFTPATFDVTRCEVLFDHPRLRVLGAPWRDVFIMKLYRSHASDIVDMATIWPRTGFTTAGEVVDTFFAAYPHAPDDEHLGSLVVQIASRAGVDLRRT